LSLCFYRLPPDALPYLQKGDTGVVHLQTHVYTYDTGRYTPQLTFPSEYNDFLKKGGRVIISQTSLSKFQNTADMTLVPTKAIYSWKQWKQQMTPQEILSVLWKGDASPLIENEFILEMDQH
jgi:hypothetical protein